MIDNIFSEVKGVWLFNNSLDDEVSNNDFQIVSNAPVYGNFQVFDVITSQNVTKTGLKFTGTTSFTAGSDFDLSTSGYQMLLMFWWYSPGSVGLTEHSITRKPTPRQSPIIAKANSTIVGGIESITSGEWIVSEIGVDNEKNAIQFSICAGGTSPTHVFKSESYHPGLHHIGILYIKNTLGNDIIVLIVDGFPGEYNTGPNTITPVGLSDIRINDIGFGYTAHKTTQSGAILGDLIIMKYGNPVSVRAPLKMMTFGLNYVVQSDKIFSFATYNAFIFQQSSTVTTNQISKSGDNIVLAKSDGHILVGSRPIWDTEIKFENPDSLLHLNTGNVDNCPSLPTSDRTKKLACWTPNGLFIQGTTIKL